MHIGIQHQSLDIPIGFIFDYVSHSIWNVVCRSVHNVNEVYGGFTFDIGPIKNCIILENENFISIDLKINNPKEILQVLAKNNAEDMLIVSMILGITDQPLQIKITISRIDPSVYS